MKAVIVYWSKTRNTEKVALGMKVGLEGAGAGVPSKATDEATDVDLFGHGLICIGYPPNRRHPTTR